MRRMRLHDDSIDQSIHFVPQLSLRQPNVRSVHQLLTAIQLSATTLGGLEILFL